MTGTKRKVVNKKFEAAMLKHGITTNNQLSRLANVGATPIGLYLTMKKCPITLEGKWRPEVIRICECLSVMPEDIFSDYIPTFELVGLRLQNVSDENQHMNEWEFFDEIHNVSDEFHIEEMRAVLDSLLSRLPSDRVRDMVMRAAGHSETLELIGKDYNGLTREAVRRIAFNGMKYLRKWHINGLKEKIF